MPTRARSITATLAVLLMAVLCASAFAQRNRQRPADPPRALTLVPTTNRDWTVLTRIQLLAGRTAQDTGQRVATITSPIVLTGATLFFPKIPGSAWATAHDFRFRGGIVTPPVTGEPRIEGGFQGFSEIAAWELPRGSFNHIRFEVSSSVTAHQTRIDERIARDYRWPELPWSQGVALCLEPQLFIEVNDDAVRDLVRRWTGGRERNARPYDLAKMLCARVMEHVEVSGDIYARDGQDPVYFRQANDLVFPASRTVAGFISGYAVNGAAFVARSRRGSPLDLACMLTAVYRAAGIPARLVIGVDVAAHQETGLPEIRAWTEFFLARDPVLPRDVPPDPDRAITEADGEWIPVDIQRQKQFGSRAPSVNQPWPFFGNHDDSALLAPIAFHFQPPTLSTSAGPPAVWGWLPQPANPVAHQVISMIVTETPRRGDDPRPQQR